MSRGRRVMCGHGVSGISSAATPSASDVGSTVRSPSALDALGGVWKRLEPSSLCHVYAEIPGPTSLFTPENTPLQLFSRFFTSEVWELLVVETNRVAGRVVEKLLEPVHGLTLLSRK